MYNEYMKLNTNQEGNKMENTVEELMANAKRAIIQEKVEELIEQVNARSISIDKAEARAAELKAAYEAI